MITESINRMLDTEAPTNPFPGLRPFEFDESHLYFGRDGQSEQLLRKLSSTRFVAVVGTSGSGKSSLVRAGLLPALYGGLMTSAGSNWRVALMRPGNDPVGNLARALNLPEVFGSEIEENAELQTTITEVTLRRGSLGLVEAVRQNRMAKHENLLVIADQFEEIFRYAQVAGDERYQNEAAAFVKLLMEAARQREINIYVVLTLRSDYLGDCSLFWDLPEAINEGQYLIPRLTREQRREAITGPIAVGGAEITPRLVNLLLNEMGDNPDQLPILQHALMRTWDRWKEAGREHEPIDINHYQATGGMSEALSRHADEAYFELPDERSREIAEKIFKALTEKGKNNRETRRPTELRELAVIAQATEQEVIAVIEPFRREGRSFLMPPATASLKSDTLIDISHESLIRNWQRLNQWVDEEARSVRIYTRLAETAALHEKGEAGLWHDPDLQFALNWREQSEPNQAWARRYHPDFERAMTFLEASREAREHEAAERERKRKRELRRTRLIAVVLLVAFIFSLASAVYALKKQREASMERENANIQRQEALALYAYAKTEQAKAQAAGENALSEKKRAEQEKERAEQEEENAKEQTAKAQAAERNALSQQQEAVRQAGIARENAHKAEVSRRSADVQRQNAIAEKERAENATKRSNHLLYAANIKLSQEAYEDKEFGSAADLLDSHWDDKDELGFEWFYLWRRYHNEQTTFQGHTDSITSVALSSDGKMLATGSFDKTIKLWDVATGEAQATLEDESAYLISSIAFSPDGKMLAVVIGKDNTVVLWDVALRKRLGTLNREGETGGASSLAFSPDSKTLVTGSYSDSRIRLWDVASRRVSKTIEASAEAGGIFDLVFSSDGKTLATGGTNNIARVWDIATGKELAAFKGHTSYITSVAFSPDGKMLATGSFDKTVKLWDVATGKEQATLTGSPYAIRDVAFSPDRRTLAVGSDDGAVWLWDIASRQELTTLKGHTDAILALAFSPDGKSLVTGSADRTAKLWKTDEQEELVTLRHKDSVLAVAFSPDNTMVATGSFDGSVVLRDTISRRELISVKGHESAVNALAFSPDGKILATGSADQSIKLWDTTSRREPVTLTTQMGSVLAIAFSADGSTLVAGNTEGKVRRWNVAAHQLLDDFDVHVSETTEIGALAFAPDGNTLAVYDAEDGVAVWNVALKERVLFLSDHAGAKPSLITTMAFSRDGKRLATGGYNKMVGLWDVASGKEIKTFKGHSEAVTSLAFSRNGKTLATGSQDKLVKLWSTTSYQELVRFKGHLGEISAIAFSTDGRVLATGSYDRYVKLWYAATGEDVVAHRGAKEQ
jgi:WD40 repeat protein/energy-coupling factor transporter ATP-binding protein EcfA2